MLSTDDPMYLLVKQQSQVLVVLNAPVERLAFSDKLGQHLDDVLTVRSTVTTLRSQRQLLPLLIVLDLDEVVRTIVNLLGSLSEHDHFLLILVLLERHARVESPNLERLATISEVHLGRSIAEHG